jgi:hypothetical protein
VQNTGGSCITMVARLEAGIELLITDCEDTLSPVRMAPRWPRQGGLHRRIPPHLGRRRDLCLCEVATMRTHTGPTTADHETKTGQDLWSGPGSFRWSCRESNLTQEVP